MRLGTQFPQKWKEKSQKEGISLADILYGYAIEDIMERITKSSFREYLWVANEGALGEDAYRRKNKIRLEFLYIEREKKTFHVDTMAGDTFGKAVIMLLEKELFKKESDISWSYVIKNTEKGIEISLTGTYLELQVPITIWIDKSNVEKKKVKEKNRLFFMDEKKSFTYFSYSRENILSEDLFEIMRKLELLSDMGCYDRVNEILKNHSISGRYIMEDFKLMGQKEPKVVTMKRLQQVTDYKEYTYMKKKWQQYARHQREGYDEWEVVMKRLLSFLTPIWTAFCEDEVFLDDWMPEIERFLN